MPSAELLPSQLDAYFEAGADAGCPADQMSNLWAAQVILPPKQLAASAAARQCDHGNGPIEIGAGGARGGGKSFWLLAQMGADDCQRHAGLKCLLLRKVGKAALESLQDLTRRVFPLLPHTLSARGVLTFANGSRIVSGHFKSEKDIDAYLGLEYDCIGVEEATTLTGSKYRAIATCCRTSKPGWRPRIYSTTNPGGIGHAFYKRRFIEPWRDRVEASTRFIPFTVDDNPFVNEGYVANLNQLVGWQRRAWRFGDWDIAAGQFFSSYSEAHHTLHDNFDESRIVEWAMGLDYGFTHPTVAVLGGRDGDGHWYILDEHVRRGWLANQHASAIRAMLARHQKASMGNRGFREMVPLQLSDLKYIAAGNDVFAKESTGRSIAKDYEDEGIKLTPANDDRINGAGNILKLLGEPRENGAKPRIHFHRRCRCVVEQVREMQHDPNRPEDVLKVDVDEEGVGGDDAYDAFRYLVMTKRSAIVQRRLTGV